MPTTPYAGNDEFADEVPLPDDADEDEASIFDPPFEVAMDRSRWLYNRLGGAAARTWSAVHAQEQGAEVIARTVIDATGGTLTSPPGWTSQGPFATATWTECTGTVFTYANPIGVDDFIVVEFDAHDTSAFNADAAYAIGFSIGGGAFALGGSFDGTSEPFWFTQSGSARVSIRAKYTGPVKSSALPIAAGGLRICLFALHKTGGSSSVQLAQPHQLVVTHYRSRDARVVPRNLIAAAWDAYNAAWWAIASSSNDAVSTSKDFGRTWTDVTAGSAGITLQTVASDASGNIVATGAAVVAGQRAYEFNAATNTWTTRSPTTAGEVTLTEVAWEPVNGIWAAYSWNAALGSSDFQLLTSPDRATWTDQTAHLPSAVANSGGVSTQPRIGVGGGRIVIVSLYGGSVKASSCAGSALTAWSTAATLIPTITSPTAVSDPVYIAERATWLIAIVGSGASFTATEIWASTDGGLTWTKTTTLGGVSRAVSVVQLAVLSPLVVSINSDGETMFSLDGGATWKLSGVIGTPGATARSIWAGDGGLLSLDTGGPFDGASSTSRNAAPNAATVGT